ncbi:MAG: flagellar biosynthesis protein FlgA [Rhodospirillaceae bacterium]|nr:flagellar biosynthesis protein FlgA [Rhodospirillaceae bacterium]OUT78206.1 MAG: flagellar biosynthesis protein FlgA [Rhodospirillaceae bacterium TMED23]|tara:strand:- start:1659 stop:2810 length:1152 start_codon:yes stop_codon:yes gene_type:complete
MVGIISRYSDRYLTKQIIYLIFTLFIVTNSSLEASAASRIKDIANFEGVRENLLVGYGLVVGLNGTGDSLQDGHFTKQSLLAMLERLGVKPTEAGLDSKNVAAVMVTAALPAFARQGNKIDVTVSALGDSSNLLGGTLLVTPLLGADGQVYAVSQGQVAVGGFTAGGEGETVTKGVPTSARIANGGIVEREIKFDLASLKKLHISLRNPDFTTSRRMAQAINAFLGTDAARPRDPGTLLVMIPKDYENNVVGLITDIEQLRIEPDQLARIIIDEQSGTIVMGDNVQISTVAIAQGSLTIRVTETPQVSQPGPFAEVGETTTVARTDVAVDENQEKKLVVVNEGVTLQDLVNGLNALGIGPRDLITILQAVKAAGALQAEIAVM